MRVFYRYNGKEFADIREVVHNNKMEPDMEYVLNEYIPYQVFVTGRTMWKGLTVDFTPKFTGKNKANFNKEEFDLGIAEYQGFIPYQNLIGAVSGGTDSSATALAMKPEGIYSGYYPGTDCDEREYSSLIAEELDCDHVQVPLSEGIFLDTLDEFVETMCTPVCGFGGVMELAALKAALIEYPEVEAVMFGNGGDEIFMGYFWNHYINRIMWDSVKTPEYMPNWLDTQSEIASRVLDDLICAAIMRIDGDRSLLKNFLTGFDSMLTKLLGVNINITLPSLLHLNQQMCKASGVVGLNPLSNARFIDNCVGYNTPMDGVPKRKLREVHDNMPQKIKNNLVKRGFPIPLEGWRELRNHIGHLYGAFSARVPNSIPPFSKLDRVAWGVSQAELFLRKFA